MRDSYLATSQVSPLEVMIDTIKQFLSLVASIVGEAFKGEVQVERGKRDGSKNGREGDEEGLKVFRKIKKVIGCFKEAGNRVGRVDRDLQEVIDA